MSKGVAPVPMHPTINSGCEMGTVLRQHASKVQTQQFFHPLHPAFIFVLNFINAFVPTNSNTLSLAQNVTFIFTDLYADSLTCATGPCHPNGGSAGCQDAHLIP